jgi:hypothetical protein
VHLDVPAGLIVLLHPEILHLAGVTGP